MFETKVLVAPGRVIPMHQLPIEEQQQVLKQQDLVNEMAELEVMEMDEIEGEIISWHACDRFATER